MKLPNKTFCILPWVSLEASPVGTVRPCCLADDELVDNAGDKFNLNTAQFTTIQNCQSMRNLRRQFLDGDQPKTCRKCWDEEKSGRTSKRLHTIERLKHMLPDQDWTIDAKPLMFLDLKLGNICNLKCRICGSWSSSTFATEELQYVDDKKSSFHYFMLKEGAWPRENKQFWAEIDQVVDQIKYLEFTGGEPFMIQEHFDMLQGLVNRGVAKNIEIHYNTNGTQFPEGASEIWKHFKTVEIAFSIDDIEERFEYQRTNAKWSDVIGNLKKFQQQRSLYPNIQLQVCTTVNIFNVYYIDQVASWIKTQNFNFVYWNILHDAPYFSIANLPTESKKLIEQKLQSARVDEDTKKEFKQIIEFMNGREGSTGADMLRKIKELDHRRNQDLAVVEPEFAKVINYES